MESTKGHGRRKRLTIELYVAYLRTATEEIEIRSLRAKIMFLMGLMISKEGGSRFNVEQ